MARQDPIGYCDEVKKLIGSPAIPMIRKGQPDFVTPAVLLRVFVCELYLTKLAFILYQPITQL